MAVRRMMAVVIPLMIAVSALGQDASSRDTNRQGPSSDERILLLAMSDDSKTDGGSDLAERRQHLLALRFRAGTLAATDTIVTHRGARETFTSRQSRLYRDRFVVCDNGDIVDLQAGDYLFRVGWYDPTYTRFADFDGDLVRMHQPTTEAVITVNLATGAVTRQVVSPVESPTDAVVPSESRSGGNLRDVGHAFAVETTGRRRPRRITHQGRPIGNERFALDDCRTGPGSMALIPLADGGPRETIAVWFADHGSWTRVRLAEGGTLARNALIGWLEDPGAATSH